MSRKIFLVVAIGTICSLGLSYVFAKLSGDEHYPRGIFESIEAKLNEDLIPINEKLEFASEGLNKVDLKVALGDVTVEPSPDEKIHVELEGLGEPDKLLTKLKKNSIETEDGVLKIKVKSRSRFNWSITESNVSFGSTNLKTRVLLPKQFLGDLEIEIGAGDLKISNSQLRELEIKTGKGEVTVEQVDARDTEINTGNGDVTFQISDPAKWTIETQVGYGNVTTDLEGSSESVFKTREFRSGSGPQKLEIKTGKGDVTLKR